MIYMNDIYHTSKLLNFILFADDTTDFYLNSNVDTLYDTINDELIEVCNWFKFNKLSLNASKTNLMFIVTPHQTKQVNDSRHIHLDGCKLTRVTEAKFLGIALENRWFHIIQLCPQANKINVGYLRDLF